MPADHSLLTQLFAEAFGSKGPELYRIDLGLKTHLFRVLEQETIVCVHFKRYGTELEIINRYGKNVVHWIGATVPLYDANGRIPGVLQGASIYSSPSLWVAST